MVVVVTTLVSLFIIILVLFEELVIACLISSPQDEVVSVVRELEDPGSFLEFEVVILLFARFHPVVEVIRVEGSAHSGLDD